MKVETKEKCDASKFAFSLVKTYIGLVIAMAFNSLKEISDYWSTKILYGIHVSRISCQETCLIGEGVDLSFTIRLKL